MGGGKITRTVLTPHNDVRIQICSEPDSQSYTHTVRFFVRNRVSSSPVQFAILTCHFKGEDPSEIQIGYFPLSHEAPKCRSYYIIQSDQSPEYDELFKWLGVSPQNSMVPIFKSIGFEKEPLEEWQEQYRSDSGSSALDNNFHLQQTKREIMHGLKPLRLGKKCKERYECLLDIVIESLSYNALLKPDEEEISNRLKELDKNRGGESFRG